MKTIPFISIAIAILGGLALQASLLHEVKSKVDLLPVSEVGEIEFYEISESDFILAEGSAKVSGVVFSCTNGSLWLSYPKRENVKPAEN